MKKTECPICGKLISNNNLEKHIRSHETHPKYQAQRIGEVQVYHLDHDDLFCKFCGKECKNLNSLRNHERLCKLNLTRQLTTFEKYGPIENFNKKGRASWNKGLTKDNDKRIFKFAQNLANRYANGELIGSGTGRIQSLESISKMLKTRASRGKKSRYKFGWYDGIPCDSSWELAFILYNKLNDIEVRRCSESFSYVDSAGNNHQYFPDFIVDDIYYEIKGQKLFNVDEKVEQFPSDKILILVTAKEIYPIIKIVKQAYGQDFTRLYDRSKPSWMDQE